MLGTAGVVALAACGETQIVTKEVPIETTVIKEVPVETVVIQEKIVTKEVPVEKIVEKIVTVEKIVEVEAAPVRVTAVVRFAHDHTSGLRGKQMAWALDKFAQVRPDIAVKFEPQSNLFHESFGIQLAAGSQAEAALLDGGFFQQWVDKGAFVQINDVLSKNPDYDATDYLFWPDQKTINFADEFPIPWQEGMAGPAFGMPFQSGANVIWYNFTMMEEAGIPMPVEGSWGLQTDYLDAMRKVTDPETNTFGIRSNANIWGFWGSWGQAFATGQHLYRSADATRFVAFEGGGEVGHQFAVDAIWKEGISNKLEDSNLLAGEFGDPFSAGRVMTQGSGSGGNFVQRIAGKFSYGLAVQPEGPNGPAPMHTSEQPHLVSNAAESNGTIEQTVDMLVFFSGPDVQERAAIDRGFVPVRKDVLSSDTMAGGPPENHGMISDMLQGRSDHRHWQSAHPDWWEWFNTWRGGADRSFIGEQTPEEGRASLMAASDRILANTHDRWLEYKAWADTLSS